MKRAYKWSLKFRLNTFVYKFLKIFFCFCYIFAMIESYAIYRKIPKEWDGYFMGNNTCPKWDLRTSNDKHSGRASQAILHVSAPIEYFLISSTYSAWSSVTSYWHTCFVALDCTEISNRMIFVKIYSLNPQKILCKLIITLGALQSF